MKLICDVLIGMNSKLCDRHDRILGSMYCRTSTIHHCERKFQVVNSTGKHTNAVLWCLSWMKQNLRDFVEHRREIVSEAEKRLRRWSVKESETSLSSTTWRNMPSWRSTKQLEVRCLDKRSSCTSSPAEVKSVLC